MIESTTARLSTLSNPSPRAGGSKVSDMIVTAIRVLGRRARRGGADALVAEAARPAGVGRDGGFVEAVDDERVLEPAVSPQFREAHRFRPGEIDDGDPTAVVRDVGGYDGDGQEQTHRVDDPELLASGDLLPGVMTPGRTGDGGGSPDATAIDDPR